MNEVDKSRLCDNCIAAGAIVCPHLSGVFDNEAKDPLIGKIIGDRYHVLAFIGSGGFGRVYRVTHIGLKHDMALKLLHSSFVLQKEKLERFKQEAEAISKLDHPNICRITDFAEGPEHQPCMIMELLEGERLDETICKKQKLKCAEILPIGIQICKALSAAHKKGIVHRDLKPANIILLAADGTAVPVVKVLDFGLAKVVEGDEESGKSLTQTGSIVGSPNYMSPEQCLGRNVDRRTDIYSIGCILYEAITGNKAFDGNSHLEILNAHIQSTPKPFTTNDLSEQEKSFEKVLFKSMEQDTDQRYQSVEELLADLESLFNNQPINIGPSKKAQKTKQKKVLAVVGVASGLLIFSVVAILGAAFLGSYLNSQDFSPHRVESLDGKTLADLNRAIEANPKSAKAFFERGRLHAQREERDNAIEDYNTALELDPNYADAYPARAEMYIMTSKEDKALADANKALQLIPIWYRGFSERARIEMLLEDYQKSIADSVRSLQLYPGWTPGYSTLSMDYSALGQHQKALDTVQGSFSYTYPNQTDQMYWNYYDRAMVYFKAHQLDEAVNQFNQAISIHCKMSQVWGDLAAALAGQGKLPEAEEAIKKAISLDLFPARALRLKGEMYRAAGKWVEAVQEYSSSTSLEPWFGPGYAQRAIAEIALGQLQSAKLDLKKALKLQPSSPSTNCWLALVEDQLGETQEAEAHMKQAFTLLPNLPISYVNRARIEMNHGDFAKAIEDCNQALSLDSRLPDAYDARAIALQTIGKVNESMLDRQAATKLHWHNFVKPLGISKNNKPIPISLQIQPPQIADLKIGKPIEIPHAEMSDAHYWAMGCGDILCDTWFETPLTDYGLQGLAVDPNVVEENRTFLADEFEIKNRDDALKFVETLSVNSERQSEYKKWVSTIKPMSEKQIQELRKRYESNPESYREVAKLNAVVKSYKRLGDRGVQANDWVEQIYICRLAYAVGYFSEEEGWQMAMKAASKLQSSYASWDDLVECYLLGWDFVKPDMFDRQESLDWRDLAISKIHKLRNDPNRPLKKLSFKGTNLGKN